MLNLPQPLTQSQATVRANYWANKRTDEPHGFAIYFCEDENVHYVVGYSDSDTIEAINPDLELVDIIESRDRYEQAKAEALRLAKITLDC